MVQPLAVAPRGSGYLSLKGMFVAEPDIAWVYSKFCSTSSQCGSKIALGTDQNRLAHIGLARVDPRNRLRPELRVQSQAADRSSRHKGERDADARPSAVSSAPAECDAQLSPSSSSSGDVGSSLEDHSPPHHKGEQQAMMLGDRRWWSSHSLTGTTTASSSRFPCSLRSDRNAHRPEQPSWLPSSRGALYTSWHTLPSLGNIQSTLGNIQPSLGNLQPSLRTVAHTSALRGGSTGLTQGHRSYTAGALRVEKKLRDEIKSKEESTDLERLESLHLHKPSVITHTLLLDVYGKQKDCWQVGRVLLC